MSVDAGARWMANRHWRARPISRSVLVSAAMAVMAAFAAGSLAASEARPGSVASESSAPGAAWRTAYDDRAAIKRLARALAGQYLGNPQALRGLGAGARSAGRNDATVADFLRLRWLGRLEPLLERYGTRLGVAEPDQLALAVAGVQYYSELIHTALLRDGPAQLVIVSLRAQRLVAYDRGQVVVDTPVTTGRPALPTDVGPMRVWKKDSPWTMQSPWPKGSPNWYPDTPVQMVVWFTKNGEGLHDASWQPAGTYGPGSQNGPYASHGCIHVPPAAEATLFNWATIGMPVVVIPGDGSPLAAQVAQESVDAMGNPIAGIRGA